VSRLPLPIARKLLTLSPGEWVELWRAQWALLVARAVVRNRPIGSLATPAGEIVPPDPARLPEARRIALAVVRVARYGITRPQCLVRSVAISRLLERRGISGGIVRIGVRRKDGEFLAHAWVELCGETLGDADEHVGTFVPLTRLDIHQPS
jgi:hypothetical protein